MLVGPEPLMIGNPASFPRVSQYRGLPLATVAVQLCQNCAIREVAYRSVTGGNTFEIRYPYFLGFNCRANALSFAEAQSRLPPVAATAVPNIRERASRGGEWSPAMACVLDCPILGFRTRHASSACNLLAGTQSGEVTRSRKYPVSPRELPFRLGSGVPRYRAAGIPTRRTGGRPSRAGHPGAI